MNIYILTLQEKGYVQLRKKSVTETKSVKEVMINSMAEIVNSRIMLNLVR